MGVISLFVAGAVIVEVVIRVFLVALIIKVFFFFSLISYSSISELRGSIIASIIASSLIAIVKDLIFSSSLVLVIVRV